MKKPMAASAVISFAILLLAFKDQSETASSWIRINQLGYTPTGIKAAVWCSKTEKLPAIFRLIDSATGGAVYSVKPSGAFGSYGPFKQTCRVDFSRFTRPGSYYLEAGGVRSPVFRIAANVYDGAADFCLRYMRQQRCGFNPFLNDSCHTHDGYALYGAEAGIPDSSYVDARGGWHDASDYLQYVTTSANATAQLLMAYRDFPAVFGDERLANGLSGKNGMADVVDEAKWGLDWLLKMHPAAGQMYNQVADDRDHMGMRIPGEDTFYGKGYARPVYFVTGTPQQRGRFLNTTTGTSSTAAKFTSAFALGSMLFSYKDSNYASLLSTRAQSALQFANRKKGNTQTVSVRSPYIYAEDNWVDDMELGYATLYTLLKDVASRDLLDQSFRYAGKEPVTPWMGTDTASHYQWYPFINLGHYELARLLSGSKRDTVIGFYREGIQRVWQKAKQNAFYRGIPFIWCSNNLTTGFAIQCYWYRQLSGDVQFSALEQANFDWLFGCNPWGTSMVYGLPSSGDTPVDPHSAFTHLKNYPIDGGLVDGPVYSSIYRSLIGITLSQQDEYAWFNNNPLAVYHDDYGDYSTNEPTMDGTASLIYLLAAKQAEATKLNGKKRQLQKQQGAIIRGDVSGKEVSLVFTADEFGEGLQHIISTLDQFKVRAGFFFTGNFYRNPAFREGLQLLGHSGHYLGPHSDKHLLYCDWEKRDSLLVTREQFLEDYQQNIVAMQQAGIKPTGNLFIPPYEWWNDSIAAWGINNGIRLFSFTPGTSTNADYTVPDDRNYLSSESILQRVKGFSNAGNLNGAILLIHAGTDPGRRDKFYQRMGELIRYLQENGYRFCRIDELLR
ncbi:MAG TPA: glycoside hydrolase family 9 protein [Chitinophagaceae bacterium]